MNDLYVLPIPTLALTSQLIHTAIASLPNRRCAHAQPRSTLDHHRRRLTAALVTELLERDTRHIGVNIDTSACGVFGAGVRSCCGPERRF
jgi:hypothetical protein